MAKRLIVEIIGDSSSLEGALGRSASASSAFGSKVAAFSKVAAVGLAAAAGEAVKMAADFQQSMEMLHTQAGVSQSAIQGLSKAVLGMAGSVATAPDELAAGLYHLSSQGLKGAQAIDALRIAAEGAKVGQADLEDVTNALGAVLASGIKGSKDYAAAMGDLNATVGAGDMHMQDLADAMGTGLTAKAAVFGVSLKDVSAALAVFGDNNIRGAEAGTQLASAIRLMGAPSHASAEALKGIGLSASSLANDMRSGGLVQAIEDLKTHFKSMGLDATQQAEVLTRAFGGKQAGGVLILMDQLDRLKTKEKEVADGASGFGESWSATTKTTSFQFDSLKTNVEALGIRFGNYLLPYANAAASSLNAFLSGHPDKGFEDLGLSAGASAEAVKLVSAAYDVVRSAGDALVSFVRAHWSEISGVIFEAAKAIEGVVRDNWGTIKAIVSGVVDVVQTLVRAGVIVVEAIWREFGSNIEAAARNSWNLIKATISDALEVIRGVVDVFTGLIHGDWSKAWDGVKEIFDGVWKQIEAAVKFGVAEVGNDLDALGKVVTALAGALYNDALAVGKKLVQGLIDGVKSGAGALASEARSLVSKAKDALEFWKSPPDAYGRWLGGLVVQGLVDGLSSGSGKVSAAAAKTISATKASIEAALPAIDAAAAHLGVAATQSVVAGVIGQQPTMTQQIKTALAQAVQQAAQAAQQALQSFQSSFGSMASGVLSAFASQTSSFVAPAQKLLNSMQAQDQLTSLQQNLSSATDAVTQAQQALDAYNATAGGTPAQLQAVADATTKVKIAQDAYNAAVSKYGATSDQALKAGLSVDSAQNALAKTNAAVGVDPAQAQQLAQQLLQAQQQYTAASRALQENDLQIKAAKQTEAYDRARAKEEEALAKQLAVLEKGLAKNPAEWDKMGKKVLELLDKYGVPMYQSGQKFVDQFAGGIMQEIPAAEKAAKAMAEAVAKYIPRSPAKTGPLAFSSQEMGAKFGREFATGIGQGLYSGQGLASIAGAFSSVGGGLRSSTIGGAGSGASPPVIVNVRVDGYVGNEQQLANELGAVFARAGQGGHPFWRKPYLESRA